MYACMVTPAESENKSGISLVDLSDSFVDCDPRAREACDATSNGSAQTGPHPKDVVIATFVRDAAMCRMEIDELYDEIINLQDEKFELWEEVFACRDTIAALRNEMLGLHDEIARSHAEINELKADIVRLSSMSPWEGGHSFYR